MKKIFGILGLFLVICILTAIASEHFLTLGNVDNLLRRSSLFGIISVGAAFVIITGGIDLSIGSVICLVGVTLPWLMVHHDWSVWAALPFVLSVACFIGWVHGMLITRLNIQPFLVTLCGLLLYRGLARGIVADRTQGFGIEFESFKALSKGTLPVFLILAVVGILSHILLERTVWGRYLKALGRNEEAARFSGINTHRMTILAYVLCSFLAGLGGVLFVVDVNSAQPSDFGNFYELYAIAGAVLGGCALRGGEGMILGVIIGGSVMQVLRNSIRLIDAIPNQLEFAVIGAVILAGVIIDELVKRVAARRRMLRN